MVRPGLDKKRTVFVCRVMRLQVLMLLLLLPLPGIAANDALGQLFTSEAERRALNSMRDNNIVQVEEARTLSSGEQAAQNRKKLVVVNGIIKRSNSDKVIWVDGEQLKARKNQDGIRLVRGPDHDGRVAIAVPGKRSVTLKPGQSLKIDNGQVVESYLVDEPGVGNAVSP